MPIGIRVTDLPAAAGTLDDDDEFLSLEDGSLRRATRAQAGPKASIVQVTDTANQFTATNVEGVLAEIQDNVDALVISGGGMSVASEAEALAGTDNTKAMTPLRVAVIAEKYDVRRSGVTADGVTDDTTALQDAMTVTAAAGSKGKAAIPSGTVLISAPIVIPSRVKVIGAGPRLDGFAGTVVKAAPGFVGDFMFVSESWTGTPTDWWHWASLEDMTIDCDEVVPTGVAIFQMGEVSTIRNVWFARYTSQAMWFTGTHAPLTVEHCGGWAGVGSYPDANHFIYLGEHPTIAGGAGGSCRLYGLSGDGHLLSFLTIDGSHAVVAVGFKTEQHVESVFVIDGGGTGGTAANLTVLGGNSDEAVGLDQLVKIVSPATPSIALVNYSYTNLAGGKIINDLTSSKSVIMGVGGLVNHPFIGWGSGQSYHGENVQFGNGAKLMMTRPDTGASIIGMEINTSSQLVVRGGSATGGVQLRSHDNTVKVQANDTGIGFNAATPVAKSTGWAAATGAATKTTFDTATVTTPQLAERVKALLDYLTLRGDIGA